MLQEAGLQALPLLQADKEAALLRVELVPGSQPWSSELHSDTCCSLTTTEKGDHFNQDIKTGNEMDRGRGGVSQGWGEERRGAESLASCLHAVSCPSPSLCWKFPSTQRCVWVSAPSTWHLLTVIMYSLLLICYGSESVLSIHQLSHIVIQVHSLHCSLSTCCSTENSFKTSRFKTFTPYALIPLLT